LIKSVAQAIPVYIMSVFLLPGTVQAELTRSIRRFWWGESSCKRKTHWIAWDKFTKPKGLGGLGFRDLKVFNQALLARQAWRLIDRPASLCARVLKAKYYPNGQLLDMAFPANQSQTWRAIAHGLELVKKGVIWRIGSGERVKIWHDPWIPRGNSLRPSGKRRPCRLKWVSQLIDRDRMVWKVVVINEYFQPYDEDHILGIRLPRFLVRTSLPGIMRKRACSQSKAHIGLQWRKNGFHQEIGNPRLGIRLADQSGNTFGPSLSLTKSLSLGGSSSIMGWLRESPKGKEQSLAQEAAKFVQWRRNRQHTRLSDVAMPKPCAKQ